MAWTEITDRDICIQGVGTKLNCMAAGTIKKGQGLFTVAGTDEKLIYVQSGAVALGPKNFIGIAAGDSTLDLPVAVYVAGSVCWTRVGTAATVGGYLYAGADGAFDDCTTADMAGMSGAVKALDTQAVAGGFVKVLI